MNKPDARGELDALVMAWARDIKTGQPRYVLELTSAQRGTKCGCECASCGLPLTAVNAAKAEFKLRPHFRHPEGAEKNECMVLSARAAALRELQNEGWIQLPRRRMSSQVAGLSGEFYEAWVELPPQKIHISQVDFRDRAAAIVTLDDGRQLRVELTGMSGALATSFDEQGLPVPTICIDINDPSLASMSPEELRQRLQLVPDPFCWRRHWDDAALLALAQEEAHRQASLYLDTVPDGLELPANMSPQLKRETVLHHVAKSILQEERRVAVPQVDAEVRIPTPGSNKGMEVHESWAMPDLMMMLDHVSLEEPFENLIPDVTCKAWPQEGGRVEWPFLIEITVTNDIDYERLERIRAVRCGALEINLGLAGGRVTREELKQLIVVELATKRWLFHPEMEEWLSDAKGRLQNQWASEQQAYASGEGILRAHA